MPQLKCIGGSAQGEFNPGVVQCYNRGLDGMEIQWECKADMDNLYRFGEIEVVCEGERDRDTSFFDHAAAQLVKTKDTRIFSKN